MSNFNERKNFMDVIEAINLLKKYNLYERAENECNRLKLDKAPYDMIGHHKVYCQFLNQKWVELRKKRDVLQKLECMELENIEATSKPMHKECYFVCVSLLEKHCKLKCQYYEEKIVPLEQELEELSQAEITLKKAAEKDFYLK